ncbi:pyridoxamine 5'-phosphate oxidase family protein [Tsukamurella sp. 8F]|uniref:pyridoxamine 5'-phosphate oxidase family protein n=1 Tax=unclassified Tsukamurella TaxID=2633480 RepID=UPI0023B8E06E|nr:MULTISPECIES: pyridoxamine 5'-phosphate oxidase family protein [unclassified Tsukamurella]MDF0529056.1 pyridoxamine 5'-phosphate oxidase family protein [Tsukamurella sp. 8J]MDF0587429.1 pyridoxamine 5'-phosphate oxidase family protein [Tsukamurella sp. 8F]
MTDTDATSGWVTEFVRDHPDAAVATLRADGSTHVARVELAAVGDRIQSTGAPSLVRTRNIRRDPRCSLFVFGPYPRWLGLDAEARILDGTDAPELLVRLLKARHGDRTPPGMVLGHDEATGGDRLFPERDYLDRVRRDQLFVFDFRILRSYGNPHA